MTFVDLCEFLIWHRKRSTQTAIALFTFFNEPFKKFELMSEQAISKARNHINEIPFIKCFKALRDFEYSFERRNSLKTYFQMFLIAIDGSTSALPNTKLPKKEFGELNGAPTASRFRF